MNSMMNEIENQPTFSFILFLFFLIV